MVEFAVCPRCGKELSKARLEKDFGGICPSCLGGLLSREEKRTHGWAATALTRFDIEHAPFKEGERFRSFEILNLVARGGMGYVYRARQTPLNRTVALKILSPELASSKPFEARFDREGKILAALSHPNIVQVFDFGREGDILYMAMEHVEGADLQTLFDRKDRLDRLRLLRIVRDVTRGLRSIHEAGLVHRDIKPANILVTGEGQAKIADFGIAIETEENQRLTETGTFIGTPHFVSPEHIQGKPVDGRSDLYSLGVILYQGLAGRPPFSAPNPTALLLKHVQEVPPAMWKSVTDIPPIVGEIVRKLLAKNPAARHDSAAMLEKDLDRAIEQAGGWQSIDESRAPLHPSSKRRSTARRSPVSTPQRSSITMRLVSGIVVGAVLLASLGIFLLQRGTEANVEPKSLVVRPPPSPTGDPLSTNEDPARPPSVFPDSVPLKVLGSPQAADSPPPVAPARVGQDPVAKQKLADLSSPERRRRLEYYVSIVNLAGLAAVYADLKGMKEEVVQLRQNMTQTDELLNELLAFMKQEGQNVFVDETLRPTDRLTTFDSQTLEKIGKEQSIALLGSFVAKVKGGSRARVTVLREGTLEEFMIRFDERPKDLQVIAQVVGLIPGQEVVAGSTDPSVAPLPPTSDKKQEDPAGKSSPPQDPASKKPVVAVKKAAVPEGQALKDAEKLIRDLFKAEYAKAFPADKLALSNVLLRQAVDTNDDPVARFVFLREARDLAAEGGDVEAAYRAIALLMEGYAVDPLAMKGTALATAAKSAKSPDELRRVAEACMKAGEAALATGDAELCGQAAELALTAARRAKVPTLVTQAESLAKANSELKDRERAMMAAKEKLAAMPEDPAVNLILGRWFCFDRGDWGVGLPHLARGADARLKELAAKDAASPGLPADQASIGDFWWEVAEKEKGKAANACRGRALYWYELAVPHLTGLAFVKVTQRINLKDNPWLTSTATAWMSADLFGHWKMDDGEGSAAFDVAPKKRIGKVQGATWTKGLEGGALKFDGRSSRVVIGAGDVPPPWTVLAWVMREDAPSATARLMDSASGKPGTTSLRLEQSGSSRRVGITKYAAVDHAFNYTAPVGTWVHLAWVATATDITLFANGASVDSLKMAMPLSVDILGTHGDNAFKGSLDDLRIYSRALEAKEIDLMYRFLPATASPPGAAQPIPDEASVKAAHTLLREIFKGDYAKKSPVDQAALVKKLLQQAGMTKDDPASRYALLREAHELASRNGDGDVSMEALDRLASAFKVDHSLMKRAAASVLSRSAISLEQLKICTRIFSELSEEARRGGDFDVADRDLETAITLARKAKDAPFLARAELRRREIKEAKASADLLKQARETLSQTPNDPAASETVGRFECFTKENWESGLALLARGADPHLKDLAARDLAAPSEAKLRIALADGWWDRAEKEPAASRISIRRRSTYWYRLALPSTSGLVRTLLEKRIAEVPPAPGGLPTDGLVGWWKFDDGAGTGLADESGGGSMGTIQGTPRWTQGKSGMALEFKGGESWVSLPNSERLIGVQKASYTLSAWFKPAKVPQGSGSANDANFAILIRTGFHTGLHYTTGGRFCMVQWPAAGSGIWATSKQPHVPAVWYHVAGSVDIEHKAVRLYINGKLECTTESASGVSGRDFGAETWKVGIAQPNANEWSWPAQGVIDEVRIYNRKLSDFEIQALAGE